METLPIWKSGNGVFALSFEFSDGAGLDMPFEAMAYPLAAARAAFPELQVWERYDRYGSAPAAFAMSARLTGKLDWGDTWFCDKVRLVVSGIQTEKSALAGLERLKAAVSGEGLDNSDGVFSESLDAFFGAPRASEEAA